MGPRTRQQPLEHRLLLTATFCLLAGGAVMVYSASSARTLLEGHGDGTAYLVKYLMYGAVGLGVMHLLSRHDLARVRRFTPLHPGRRRSRCCCSCSCPGIGVKVNGARRWLGAGPLQFQAAEVMKLALVLHASAVLSGARRGAPSLRRVARPDLPARRLRGAAGRRPARPRHRARDLLHARGAARRGGAAAAPARARRRRSAPSWSCSSRCSSPTGARG